MQLQAEYFALTDLFVQLVESNTGGKIESGSEWLNDAQVLSIKLYKHLHSMQRLAQEESIAFPSSPPVAFIDHASVQVVARAALETYLVFFYIYGTTDQSLSQFRHKTWHLAGLLDRQKYSVLTEEAREVMTYEREVIHQLKFEIPQSAHFACFSRRQRQQLMLGSWRVGKTWKDLGEQAGFHGRYFENIYNYPPIPHMSSSSLMQFNAESTIRINALNASGDMVDDEPGG